MPFDAAMDSGACNILYVSRHARQDALARARSPDVANGVAPDAEPGEHDADLKLLLDTFRNVHLCSTGTACLEKLFQLQDASMIDLKPTIVLIDTPWDERIPEPRIRSRSPSPHSRPPAREVEIHTPDEEELYGLKLLQRIITEAHLRSLSKLIIPIPVVSQSASAPALSDRKLLKHCLDTGAIDVLLSPLHPSSLTSLEVHAYRGHKDAAREQQALMEVRKGRKRSWVGVNEEKPFAYLREAMVSNLMKNICRTGIEADDRISNVHIAISSERRAAIAEAVGRWHFCAHSFTDDELLVAAMVMFNHALSMPELERWRISADQLVNFLIGCRQAYNAFVPFHNFRHVVDVLQATFHFLVSLGILAPYPSTQPAHQTAGPTKSPMTSLLGPVEGLTLLVTAIGHDAGHPGVNNGFLVTLNAPLAQLYNDRSVLESFHCAAYSQILRRFWPSAFEDTRMRSLMISSILATDMGLHFDYMKKLGDIQEKLHANNTTEGWNGRMLEEQKALACALLIKCADISNVSRKFETAIKWMNVLTDEFSRQASMETELGIQSSLLAPPKKDVVSLSRGQLGFMNMFAIPLFQGVADLMPGMGYTVNELEINKARFEKWIRDELAKEEPQGRRLQVDGTFSPRTMSFAAPVDDTPQSADGGLTTPGALIDGKPHPGNGLSPPQTSPTEKPVHIPNVADEYKEVNGIVTSFDTVADFAASDPFDFHQRTDSVADGRMLPSSKQRCSETTDGSTGPYSGDWASQATSATTGKMPLSPSTQGTSIVSRESMERPSSVPRIVTTIPPEIKLSPEPKGDAQPMEVDSTHSNGSNGTIGKSDGKAVKKKPSRFRMNAFPFFRRHKGSSPTMPAADTAG